jgi:alpha-N-acetylglucosaminidase
MKTLIFICNLAIVLVANAAEQPIQALIERITPGHTREFVIETIPADNGNDVFGVAPGTDGQIILRGNNPLAQAVAFNHYLKYTAHVEVSWYVDTPVRQLNTLPPVTSVTRKTTKLKDRFFLNYCTFGYTMPWWQWRDWERLIDWMALNGVTLPLAQGANETVWQRVWRSYGLTDEEIRGYFTGPAVLPWNRMANIDKWGGPLPQSYIDGQFKLTKKILARERAFGMKPILPAFAGHAPAALKRVRPDLKLTRLAPWPGMAVEHSTSFIDPKDPLFHEIQVRFLKEQEAILGTDHLYGTDPFNEMNPPSWEPAFLGSVAKSIYQSMADADSDAVWFQMGWTFKNSRKQWTNPRIKAMIDAVPKGKMVLLDYDCEAVELYKSTDRLFGAPVIWCYLGNFGGNNHIVGPLNLINNRLSAAMNAKDLPNLVGVGGTLEGLNNQPVYEFVFERAWLGEQADVAAWVRDNARCHAGGSDAAMEDAWDIIRKKILVDSAHTIGGHGVCFQAVPRLTGKRRGWCDTAMPYHNTDLVAAWRKMLEAAPETRKSDAYLFDLADTTRQAIGNAGHILRLQMLDAHNKKDAVAFRKLAARFLEMGNDLDTFLGTRSEFLLGKWVTDARAWGKDAAEADFYERNARTLLSTWVGRGNPLTDYASRCWNGMLSDYYMARWKLYLDNIAADLDAGKSTDFTAIEERMKDFEWQWAQDTGGKFRVTPGGDAYVQSKALLAKYADLLGVVR